MPTSTGAYNIAGSTLTKPDTGQTSWDGAANGDLDAIAAALLARAELQASTPGTQQTGHLNISGTLKAGVASIAGAISGGSLAVTGAATVGTTLGVTGAASVGSLSSSGAVSGTTGTFTGDLASSGNLTVGGYIQSTSPLFSTGVQGWRISNDGTAEFNNVRARGSFESAVFRYSDIVATAGSMVVTPSASSLTADCTTANALAGSFTLNARNDAGGNMLFAVGDRLRLKVAAGSDSWATVTARTNNGTDTTYTCTLQSGSTNATFRAGTAVLDYGGSGGAGFLTLSADGAFGSSANLSLYTHAGSPWSATTLLARLGNLNGSYGFVASTNGLGIGDYSSGSYLTYDPSGGIKLANAGITLKNGSNTTVSISATGNTLIGTSVGNLASATPTLMALPTGATVNSETLAAGSLLIGSNASSNANLLFDPATGRLNFRSGSGTPAAYVNATTGALTAGGGNVVLDASGLTLANNSGAYAQTGSVNFMTAVGGTTYSYLTTYLPSAGNVAALWRVQYPSGSGTSTAANIYTNTVNAGQSYDAQFYLVSGTAATWGYIRPVANSASFAFGIGAHSSQPSATLHVLNTVEQLRLDYGGTNKYVSFLTNANGDLIATPRGAAGSGYFCLGDTSILRLSASYQSDLQADANGVYVTPPSGKPFQVTSTAGLKLSDGSRTGTIAAGQDGSAINGLFFDVPGSRYWLRGPQTGGAPTYLFLGNTAMSAYGYFAGDASGNLYIASTSGTVLHDHYAFYHRSFAKSSQIHALQFHGDGTAPAAGAASIFSMERINSNAIDLYHRWQTVSATNQWDVGIPASSTDLWFKRAADGTPAMALLWSSQYVQTNWSLKVAGNVGFYGTTPIAQPSVTGSRSTQTVTVLANLLTALANLGLIANNTTA